MSMLGDKERAVIDTITMRFHAPEALVYLENLGMKMGIATYYRYRKKVENMKLERMQFIAQHFQELHLEKIDRLELIDRLMWENYEKEKDPTKKVKILETIADAQATVSSYYESTTIALEVSAKFNGGNGHDNDKNPVGPMKFDEWFARGNLSIHPPIDDSDEENGQYYRDLLKAYDQYVKDWHTQNFGPDADPVSESWTMDPPKPRSKAIVQIPPEESIEPKPNLTTDIQELITQTEISEDTIDIDILGRQYKPFDVVQWIECTYPDCKKWFKNKEILNKHFRKYHNPLLPSYQI